MDERAAGRRTYGRLFGAHVVGLIATGIATVALALLAYDLADDQAGAVLGTALAIKMATNVVIAPIAAALAEGVPRRPWLSFLAIVRAGALCFLPFVSEAWHIFALLVVFQAAAAASAATYLATVPDLLPDPDDYAAAVGKSRIAYEAENLLSPLIAALLLTVLGFRDVFLVGVVLFLFSAGMLARLTLPEASREGGSGALIDGFRRLLGARAMRCGLLINAAGLIVGSMVTVNTVILVREWLNIDGVAVAIALAAFGAGSIVAALTLPRLLRRWGERSLMLLAGVVMTALLASGTLLPGYVSLLALWVALGACTTFAQLPISTLIGRMSKPGERQGLYAANYAINHTILMVAYAAAGWAGATAGLVSAFLGLSLLCLVLVAIAAAAWPRSAAPTLTGAPPR